MSASPGLPGRVEPLNAFPVGKGPDGARLCRWCQGPIPRGRRTLCSRECSEEILVRTSASGARALVFERDGGRCAHCGLDTAALEVALLAAWRTAARRAARRWRPGLMTPHQFAGDAVGLWRTARGFTWEGTLWNVDHVRPVVEGGGACGLANLRTLCVPCHRVETRVLAGRRASARRKNRRRTATPGSRRR